jgi:phosphate transport system permease protein
VGAVSRLRRRKAANRVAEATATLAALTAVGVLVLLVGSVFLKGYRALDVEFFTKGPAVFGQAGGGIAPALVGSLELVLFATLGALPLGVLIAIYVCEIAPERIGRPLRVVLDVLNGFPSIVIGIFVFALLVVGNRQSGLAGSFALGTIMLPLVARATMEMLEVVPASLREASTALGAPRWRTTVSIVLPSAFGGILTGTTLAVARAAGETAPLLFTSFNNRFWSTNLAQPIASLTVQVFTYAISPYEDWHRQAWAGAFLLVMMILALSMIARFAVRRLERMNRP